MARPSWSAAARLTISCPRQFTKNWAGCSAIRESAQGWVLHWLLQLGQVRTGLQPVPDRLHFENHVIHVTFEPASA
jgi:hypothetical protein